MFISQLSFHYLDYQYNLFHSNYYSYFIIIIENHPSNNF